MRAPKLPFATAAAIAAGLTVALLLRGAVAQAEDAHGTAADAHPAPAHGAPAEAEEPPPWHETAQASRQTLRESLATWSDLGGGSYQMPIEHAMQLVIANPMLLEPVAFAIPDASAGPAERGRALFTLQLPCSTCHAVDGTRKIGPPLNARFGSTTLLEGGATVAFDEAYVRESILNPTAKVAQTYPPVMPPQTLTEEDFQAILAYLRSL